MEHVLRALQRALAGFVLEMDKGPGASMVPGQLPTREVKRGIVVSRPSVGGDKSNNQNDDDKGQRGPDAEPREDV